MKRLIVRLLNNWKLTLKKPFVCLNCRMMKSNRRIEVEWVPVLKMRLNDLDEHKTGNRFVVKAGREAGPGLDRDPDPDIGIKHMKAQIVIGIHDNQLMHHSRLRFSDNIKLQHKKKKKKEKILNDHP
mmetsp:Transcript_47111/g.78199  ORF Transcript_47111/g.78199 Transcript_47111/m.78199 type:complete len:127 (-) Transcript_47111:318-698(-)|eukprot:CAMPEP_0202686722 /NCGR_PEP_ID=MMETSP1385-20130828/2485_1 /ASSEMBLY_ACC=CAM_ASM_000861 /TAXON_ID=933848 /ORGANISM="Elphidium margaritaceum" /LENGTH=126 /DNA_ID=CAMNT_0049341359 /DNA_START=378 /DNA_END=758 /DNA_ORIENTATION=+